MLATIDDLKAYLSISGATDDPVIESAIKSASVLISSIINRDIETQQYTATYDGSGNVRQVLSFFPVTAISSLTVNGVAKAAATSFGSSGYRFDDYSVILNNEVFPKGIQNVTVVYTAGYASVPADLKQACVDLAAEVYRRRNRVGETSKAIAGGTTSYSVADIPPHVRTVINQYRKMSPV
jgi:uncharacterized phiE125 gp8 family phage protein